jgi:hypothetical protein
MKKEIKKKERRQHKIFTIRKKLDEEKEYKKKNKKEK